MTKDRDRETRRRPGDAIRILELSGEPLPRAAARCWAKQWQRDVVVLLVPLDFDAQADRQVLRLRLDADNVGHHARTFIELDDGDDIRRVVLEAGRRAMGDDVGVQLAAAAR